ncbi:MAG: YbaK/EbsC family protein [Pseudomonadota bacterium]|nr:MAG: YbaK/EbsC family protein [Pseudomonadota bacterium]
MAMAMTLKQFLAQQHVDYELLAHEYTGSSMETAEAAHVPGEQLAKPVILEDETGYLMAVIPATHWLEIGVLSHQLERRLGLATESEISTLFDDCDIGAIPPLGQAWGMDVIIDDSLQKCDDIYFEAGDHTELVHMRGKDFEKLLAEKAHGTFSHHR